MKRIIILSVVTLFLLLIVSIIFLLTKSNNKSVVNFSFPTVEVMDLSGKIIRLEKPQDKRPTFLLYFNTECKLCESVITDMLMKRQEFDKYRLIFVSIEEIDELKQFLKKQSIDTFKHSEIYTDYKMNLSGELQIKSPPTYFIFDDKGQLIRWSTGVISATSILKILRLKDD